MKKIKVFIGATLALFLLSACSDEKEIKEEPKNNEEILFEYYVDSLIYSYDAETDMYEFKRLVEENIDEQHRFKEGNSIAEEGKELYQLADSSFNKLTFTRSRIEQSTTLSKEEKETLLAYYDETIEYMRKVRSYSTITQALVSNPDTPPYIEDYQKVTQQIKETQENVQNAKEKINKLLPVEEKESLNQDTNLENLISSEEE